MSSLSTSDYSEDDLTPARGVLNGLLIALPIWVVVIVACALWWLS